MQNKKINVLILGLGPLAHGIIKKFEESELLGKIYLLSSVEPTYVDCTYIGSTKTTTLGQLKSIIKGNNIDFAISFHELYSMSSLAEFLQKEAKIPIIEVNKDWFILEASKIKCKEFMKENGILTADYLQINEITEIENAIDKFGLPIVIKNNYLQAGFGSYICKNKKSAIKRAKELIKKSKFCIAERFIVGKEVSQQYLWDKNTLLPLLPVKDFKKSDGGENAINTGSMGSYTPVLFTEKEKKLLEEYNLKIAEVFKKEKPNFTGIFTTDLLYTEDKIYTLEFNMRPGLPEFEVLIEHINSDLLKLLYDCAYENLQNSSVTYKDEITGCICLAHPYYIKRKSKSIKISLKKDISPFDENIKLNFGVTKFQKNGKIKIETNFRFLTVLCTDKNDPFDKIYKYLETIKSPNIYYRKDIRYER